MASTRWRGSGGSASARIPGGSSSSGGGSSVPEFQGYEHTISYEGWPTNPDGSRIPAQQVIDQGIKVVRSDGTVWTPEQLQAVAANEAAPPPPTRAPKSDAELYDPYLNPSLLPDAPTRPDIPTTEDIPETTDYTESEVAQENAPAELDRSRIDEILGRVNQATSGILGIANTQDEYSAAQAQLALGLAQSQRSNLSLARSGNRRDAAALGARALQTNAEQSAEATRSAALLRAQEEDALRQLRLDAFAKAGELGLNAGALEVDIESLNMESVTNYLNQLFETERVGMTLNQRDAERLTNFIRDMALISKDYYALSMEERQHIRDDLTRRAGISTELAAVIAQLDSQPGFWENAALGAISAGGQVGAALIAKSDRRAKESIHDAVEADLEALLDAVGAKTFYYKRPERDGDGQNLGVMAQDLRKTKFGKSLTFDDKDGEISVDGSKAGLAALAGLSMVYEKLKELEEAL